MRDPLLAPMAAVGAGVVAARCLAPEPGELALACGALALLALTARIVEARRAGQLCRLALLGVAGAFAAAVHRPDSAPRLDAAPREVVTLSGCVAEPPDLLEDREQFVLELAPGARARVSLYAPEDAAPPALAYGQRVEVEGRIRPVRNFENPGAFDYAGYLGRRNIYWLATARGDNVRILDGGCGSRFRAAIFALRGAALRRIDALYPGDRYQASMMRAILIGDASRLEKVWTEDFRRTGTYHALVISGLHITVLAGVFLFLLRLCAVPDGTRLALAALAAWLYALLSGWTAPVVRAAAGFSLFALGRHCYRQGRLLNLLAAVAIGFVAFDPEQMFEASFQLSFLSVAAIGALGAPLLEAATTPLAGGLRGLADPDRDPHLRPRVAHFRLELRLLAETLALATRLPQRLWLAGLAACLWLFFHAFELIVVSAVVQLGLVLPMVFYFHRLSLTGLTANVLIVPLMSLLVPVGFLALFTNWSGAAAAAAWLLAASRQIAAWHARWEPGWRIPDPPFWLAAALAAVLLALFFGRRRVLWLPAAAALLALVIWHPFPPGTSPGTLEVAAVDVGQGESLFVGFPNGELMVLDGGGIPALGRRRPRLDIGEDVVSPYLWSRSIRRLDILALSHAHDDHLAGLSALLENFRPKQLWTGALPRDPAWTALCEQARRQGVAIVSLHAGQFLHVGGTPVEVLAPEAGYQPRALAKNNDSLVLRLRHGRHAFLLAGDMERQLERQLLDAGRVAPADVLKVAHHGGKNSSGDEFLEAVRPCFALLSAGYANSYNFPSPAVLARLAERKTEVLRTDLLGLVMVRSDGRRLSADANRWSAGGHGLNGAF